jgi:hypothetical protein
MAIYIYPPELAQPLHTVLLEAGTKRCTADLAFQGSINRGVRTGKGLADLAVLTGEEAMVSNTKILLDQVNNNDAPIDLQTVRRRVAEIKASWTVAERHARSTEGARRREELARILWDCVEGEETAGRSDGDNLSCAQASQQRNRIQSMV